jgi:uncharacterized protein YegP (UPF0339 family)
VAVEGWQRQDHRQRRAYESMSAAKDGIESVRRNAADASAGEVD